MKKTTSVSYRNKLYLGVALLVVIILLVATYYLKATCLSLPGMGTCQRVLFIGNSYTYVNDLPQVFTNLARSGGYRVQTGMAAQGGWTLSDHVSSSASQALLRSSKWDIVVLQEQSETPAIEQSRTTSMYPAARQLVGQITGLGARPVFFITWAHREGLPDYGLLDFQSMQFSIDRAYLGIAGELNVPLAPVGYAWLIAYGQDPQLELWQQDGSHPTQQGTYLAACVFYAAIFHQSPEGLNYLDQLAMDVAKELQTVAANTVLNDAVQWNIH